jgi:hypothetical protein
MKRYLQTKTVLLAPLKKSTDYKHLSKMYYFLQVESFYQFKFLKDSLQNLIKGSSKICNAIGEGICLGIVQGLKGLFVYYVTQRWKGRGCHGILPRREG